jgi:RimJ/RimL family protein N-acetyltransferase
VSTTLRAAPPEHFRWLAARARLTIGTGFQALEVVKNGTVPEKILGMVGFDGWTATSVSLHVAVDDPRVLRRLIKPAFGVAFYEFGKEVITVTVLSTNERSLKLVKGLGFREVYRGKDWVDRGVDLVIHEMRRNECRWLEA